MPKAKRSIVRRSKAVMRRKPQTSTAIVHVPVAPERPWELNEEAVTILKNSVAKGASDEELKYCLTVARRYRLDPFKQQIWFVKRWDSGADNGKGGKGAFVWTPQVGINGLLFAAARDHKDFGSVSLPEYGAMQKIEWKLENGNTVSGMAPEWARVKVWKKGEPEPTEAQAWWDEYAPAEMGKAPFWRKMPRRMIGKCATALAIRQAYPDLGGVYIPEEMERMGEDITPGGRQIIPSGGSHAAAQRVLEAKLASGNPNPIEPEIVAPTPSKTKAQPTPEGMNNAPKAQIPQKEWRGTVEIDWSADKAFPRVLGDIAEVAAHFPGDLVLKRKEDFWHAFAEDVPRIKAVCDTQNFKVIETSSPQGTAPAKATGTGASEAGQKTTPAGGRSIAGASTEPTLVKCNIEKVKDALTSKKAPMLQICTLQNGKRVWYSAFDQTLFDFLKKGVGRDAELLVKGDKYVNIVGLKKVGAHEFDDDGKTEVIQRDRPAGGRTLFP
jgi:RecT family protein